MRWSSALVLLPIFDDVLSASNGVPYSCRKFSQYAKLENTTFVAVGHFQNGTQIPLPGTVKSCGGPDSIAHITANLCRIVLDVATTSSSSVRLEAWLPDEW